MDERVEIPLSPVEIISFNGYSTITNQLLDDGELNGLLTEDDNVATPVRLAQNDGELNGQNSVMYCLIAVLLCLLIVLCVLIFILILVVIMK